MKVMVVGGGGREHALAWKCAQSPRVEQVLVAPGNAGTALETRTRNLAIGAEDIDALIGVGVDERIDLTIIGPEAPLVAGVVDAFESEGLRCFGPRRDAARLEGSKIFCKDFLSRHGIPTGAYRCFDEPAGAQRYIREHGAPVVIKADGLAAGKGVVVASTVDEAIDAANGMLAGTSFGDAGSHIVVEDCLQGEEASFMVLVDGRNAVALASSQDHKARDDGDVGPNTGGMGAYSPAPVVDVAMHERVMREVIMPTVDGMASEGMPYKGFLYAGLMIGDDGVPNVLEFNCRLGDPETQPILMRLRSDLVDLCEAALDERLDDIEPQWDTRMALGVVMAAGGYPGEYRKGDLIGGLELAMPDTKVFHAGTAAGENGAVTAGGRVLCVCGLGDSVSDAQRHAYRRVHAISWPDAFFRSDIGHRAAARD